MLYITLVIYCSGGYMSKILILISLLLLLVTIIVSFLGKWIYTALIFVGSLCFFAMALNRK